MKNSWSKQVTSLFTAQLLWNFLRIWREKDTEDWEFLLTLLHVHVFSLLISPGIGNMPFAGFISLQFCRPHVILNNWQSPPPTLPLQGLVRVNTGVCIWWKIEVAKSGLRSSYTWKHRIIGIPTAKLFFFFPALVCFQFSEWSLGNIKNFMLDLIRGSQFLPISLMGVWLCLSVSHTDGLWLSLSSFSFRPEVIVFIVFPFRFLLLTPQGAMFHY